MIKFLAACSAVLISLSLFSQKITAVNLKCEYKVNPVGLDMPAPKFSWEISSTQRGCVQVAYRVQVSDDSVSLLKNTGKMWDEGKKNSPASIQVTYAGKKLQPARTYFWRVQVWDNHNNTSKWSSINKFTTGLFSENDWGNAKWIGYEELPDSLIITTGVHGSGSKLGNKGVRRPVSPYFRKEFAVRKKVKSALMFISGLGHYEMSLNGKPVSDDFLNPGWTDYRKTCLYNTYDITSQLNNGANAIGVIAGNGFYNVNRERYRKLVVAHGMPKMICILKITYTDGTTENIVSGKDWKTDASPITFNSIYSGEDYDATKEQPGWNKPGFNEKAWKNALLVREPTGRLKSALDYPVKVHEVFEPKTVNQPMQGIYVYDFGQNASGIVELKVRGQKGQTIKLTPSELLYNTKLANQKATGSPYYFSYTLKGDGEETWRPRFTYYGFRYVQVEGGIPENESTQGGQPKITGLRLLHTRNSAPQNGTFECSNELFNRTFSLIDWAIKSNMQSVMTDCPHREKLSWLEQDYLMGGSIHYNYDIYTLYKKLVRDMMDAQLEDGMVPEIAPEYVRFEGVSLEPFLESPEWGSASVIVPWLLYTWYGDREILKEAYPMMKKYVAYLKGRSNNHILSHGLGDWFDLGPNRPGVAQLTPKEVTATSIYYYDLVLLSKMAGLLDDHAEAASLLKLSEEVKTAFNNTFFNVQTKVYSTGSQTAMSMPLCVGLVDEKYKSAVVQNLVSSIEKSGKALTAGDIGFHFLVKALDDNGQSQLLYEMNYRDDVPGYGFQLKKGATALTESWAALEEVSNNHLMLGHIMEWFYSGLAGITAADESIAFDHIKIRPQVVGNITHAKGSFQSPYGVIKSEWKKENGAFVLNVSIPANTKATVYLPASASGNISEGGTAVGNRPEFRMKDKSTIEVGSGEYRFEVR